MLCSAKSQDSSQAICPIYIHICPPITKLTETKLHVHVPGKSLFKSFTPSSLLLYMEEKLTIIVESKDNDIEKLILNAAPESILHKKVNTIF